MHLFTSAYLKRAQWAIAATALLIFAPTLISAQEDPPAQAGRLSYITGNVSIQQAGSNDWGQAYPNLPLGPGDRIVTEMGSQAEIQVGQTFVRVGANADVSLINSTPQSIAFGVAQGSIHVHVNGLWDRQSVFVNTPNGSAALSRPGQLRVDVLPGQEAAFFTMFGSGSHALITGAGGFAQEIFNAQTLELAGTNPVTPQSLQPAEWDALDQWSFQRDRQISNAASYQYVSSEIPGAYELDAAGDWRPDTPYGPVWFPRNVPGGWAPYHYGHWVNHAPWGWVWVEDEPWGYAPFHYGRWVNFEGRWGWVPGPPAAHPVWSPALVVFAGGIHVGGGGVSAWFPLGPGEPYHPWYHASPHYMDQVNITNIRESPRVHVQNTYVNVNVVNVTYVNRTIGASAMRQEDFAAGRSAHQAPVAVDVHDFEHPQVVEHIDVPPPAHPFAGRPPMQPVRVSAERPVLINENGKQISAKPGAPPIEPPVRPTPPLRPLPGRTMSAPPSSSTLPPSATTRPTPAAAPVPTPAGKPPANPTASSPIPPAILPPARPSVPGKLQPTPTPAPSSPATTVSKPSGVPQQPSKPPVAQPPARPIPQTPAKPAESVKPEPRPTPAPASPSAPVPKPTAPPAQPARPPVAQPPAKPAAQAPARPAAPAAEKPPQENRNEKGKRDEKKTGN